MGSHVQQRSTDTDTNPRTILGCTVGGAGDVAAGNLLVICVGVSNLSTTVPPISSIAVPSGIGETASWVKLISHPGLLATSNACTLGEMWAIKTTVAWPSTANFNVTFTSSSSDEKTAVLDEFSGYTTTVLDSQASAEGTNAASASLTNVPSGSLVVGFSTARGSYTAATWDSDTTNGSWSTVFGSNTGGSGTAYTCVGQQYKIPNASGAQTFNVTLANRGGIGAVVLAADVTNISISRTFKWNVKAQVTKSSIFKWNVLGLVTKTSLFKWNVFQRVLPASFTAKWGTRISVTPGSFKFVWNVAETLHVGGNFIFKWNTIQTLTKSTTFKWNVLQSISKSSTFKWNVYQQVLKTFTSRFNVYAVVVGAIVFRYNVRQLITKAITFKWNITGGVAGAITFSWRVFRGWFPVPRDTEVWDEIPRDSQTWTELPQDSETWTVAGKNGVSWR